MTVSRFVPRTLRRRSVIVAMVATTVVALGASPASAADYGSLCVDYDGLQVKTSGGTLVAVACSNNNVTKLYSRGSHWDVSKKMSLKVCAMGSSGGPVNCHSDTGTYKYFAGPVSGGGGCHFIYAKIWKPGDSSTLVVDRKYTLCN